MVRPADSQYRRGLVLPGPGVPSGSYGNIRSVSETGEQVLALHRQGVRSIDIAHRLNVAQATVHYHLRRLAEPQPVLPARASTPPSETRGANRTRERVAELLAAGLTRTEIARRLGVTKGTVSYHARRLGEPLDERCRRRYDWSLVQAFYDEGHSMRECKRAFGFSHGSWHDAVKRAALTPRPAFRPVDEVFAVNTRRNRGHLKTRLLRLGIKDGRCERCGLARWLRQPVALALHHVNGDRLDNRVQNLELLCPNCHSQTENFSGRNGRRAPPEPAL